MSPPSGKFGRLDRAASDGCRSSAGSADARTEERDILEQPSAPRKALPSARPWLLGPRGGAPGRGWDPAPCPFPAASRPPPGPGGRAPDPAAGSESLLGADARPAENSPPFPREQCSRLRSPSPTSRGKPRAASAQRPLRGRALAPRLDDDTERPPDPVSPPTSDEKPPPRAHGDARTPAALGVQSPSPGCHRAPGPESGSPPAAAGPSAACSPSRRPRRPAKPQRPPLRVGPKLAARRGVVPEGK